MRKVTIPIISIILVLALAPIAKANTHLHDSEILHDKEVLPENVEIIEDRNLDSIDRDGILERTQTDIVDDNDIFGNIEDIPDEFVQEFSIGGFFSRILEILVSIVGIVAVIFIIIAGFRFIISSGSEEGMSGATRAVIGVIIGLAVVLLAFAIVAIVANLLQSP